MDHPAPRTLRALDNLSPGSNPPRLCDKRIRYGVGGLHSRFLHAYAASAFTSLAFLRAFLSAAFPLFTEQLLDGLGNNVAGSILAGIATLFCIVPVLLVKYGKELRGRSRFARESMGSGSGEEEGEGEGNGRGELVQMLERERRARGRGGRGVRAPPVAYL
jgi:hypothetical protein